MLIPMESSLPVDPGGYPFKELFAGHGVEEFFRESVKMNPHIIEDMHHIPRPSNICRPS